MTETTENITMWFKNLQIYRLPAPWAYTPEQLEAALAPHSFVPANSNELLRQGWDTPRPNGGLVHVVNKQMLILLGTEKKLLPSSVINQVAKARAAEMEEAQGFAPGRKAMKELKERVADELLPRAFPIRSNIWVWIDPVNGWLVVDAASPAKADEPVRAPRPVAQSNGQELGSVPAGDGSASDPLYGAAVT